MSYEFCPACHKYREMTRHVCEPEWLVLQDDDEEGWDPKHARRARGRDPEAAALAYAERLDAPEAAALAYAERLDACERDVLSAGSVLIWVAPVDGSEPPQRWRVRAEASVDYDADLEPPDGSTP